jgi:hypothetical protein
MGQAAENGELIPVSSDLLQMIRKFIVAAFTFWEKQLWNET